MLGGIGELGLAAVGEDRAEGLVGADQIAPRLGVASLRQRGDLVEEAAQPEARARQPLRIERRPLGQRRRRDGVRVVQDAQEPAPARVEAPQQIGGVVEGADEMRRRDPGDLDVHAGRRDLEMRLLGLQIADGGEKGHVGGLVEGRAASGAHPDVELALEVGATLQQPGAAMSEVAGQPRQPEPDVPGAGPRAGQRLALDEGVKRRVDSEALDGDAMRHGILPGPRWVRAWSRMLTGEC
ncbi:MAG: hypothetical protein PHN62_05560 [Neomegalonema sp.]|nr:hypothetical protein [Neomegalonema sp.]MDD2868037.1 hypothetical protein [Neomegalonema sp.]